MTDAPTTFADLGVSGDLVAALNRREITTPFPIQKAAIPGALAGRDVLGKGRTGSGKTMAFALPIVQRLADDGERRRPGRPRALILVPTRELAIQVAESVEFLAHAMRLTTMTILGGVRYTAQLRRLERGVDIVVATPGRLEDLLAQEALTLAGVSIVVVDEADLMADMGFLPPVTRLLEQVPPGQRMLFSATLDGDVGVIVDRFLRKPLKHSVDEERSNAGVRHHLFLVSHENKREVLTELVTGAGRTLLFVRTKTFAEKLAADLTSAGIPTASLHGDLRQGARQRNLAAFADGRVGVLVATDIAARGLHIDDIGLVIHVDPPTDPKAFLHRSGRTARAGAEGAVVTLSTRNQNKTVKALMAQAHIKPLQRLVEPGCEAIAEVRAPVLEHRGSGSSMFTPNPDDLWLDDAAGGRPAPESGRRGRGPRPDRVAPERRGDRAGKAQRTSSRPAGDPPKPDPWGRRSAAEAAAALSYRGRGAARSASGRPYGSAKAAGAAKGTNAGWVKGPAKGKAGKPGKGKPAPRQSGRRPAR